MNQNPQTSQIRYQNVRLMQITPAFFEYQAIYKGNKREVRLKIQNSINQNILQEETDKLLQLQDIEGIPEVIDYGNNNDQRYFLATQNLGPSLSQILKANGQMSQKSILLIGIQLIKLIQKIHDKNLIVCNLMPQSLCMGFDADDKLIYLKDLSFLQSNEVQNKCIKFPIKDGNFLSPMLSVDRKPNKIDDLYSLTYLLIYLNNGTLPWQSGDSIINEQQFQEFQMNKLKVTFDKQFLDQESSIYGEWIKYLKTLKQHQHPNYTYLKNILISKIYENGWKINDQIDYRSDLINNSSKSIISIKSRSRGTSITKTPVQRMIDVLSPIKEVDKEFELAQSTQKKADFQIFQQFINLREQIDDQYQLENNISFTSQGQNECEIWKKMEKLDKLSKPIKMMYKYEKI
ncbi:unnamed protein product [Paramecium sonneborni]|uniref:Protein kinase domain-containing protein n=1 Tax=Paramecium sonneborni TaxID=65129 RepID=A0A8S1QVB1_9CILI|nr:unnamed protein product [Paramecium sonneborni]